MKWLSIAFSTQASFAKIVLFVLLFHAVMAMVMCCKTVKMEVLHCCSMKGFRRLWNSITLGDTVVKVTGLAVVSQWYCSYFSFYIGEKHCRVQYFNCLWARFTINSAVWLSVVCGYSTPYACLFAWCLMFWYQFSGFLLDSFFFSFRIYA